MVMTPRFDLLARHADLCEARDNPRHRKEKCSLARGKFFETELRVKSDRVGIDRMNYDRGCAKPLVRLDAALQRMAEHSAAKMAAAVI